MGVDFDDNDLELDSSLSTDTLDDVSIKLEGETEAPASSSDADGANGDKSSLDVVRDVVGTQKSDAASPADGSETGTDAGGTATQKELDDDKFTDVPFHKHPRFKQLLTQRDTFREDAGRYQNVQGFLDTHGLTGEEAANGLTVFAQAKVDPAGAFQALKPWLQDLLHRAGETLPNDLEQRVQNGEFSREAAMEINRSRAKVSSVEAQQSFAAQRATRQAETERVNSMTGAASEWEADRRLKDPNFEAKFVPLQKEVAYIQLQEGKPKDAVGVKDQLVRAYKAVNESLRPATQPASRKQALRPVNGGQVASVQSKPESTLDIIRAHRRTG